VVIVLLLVPGGLASLAWRTRDAVAGPRLPRLLPDQRSSPAGASREG